MDVRNENTDQIDELLAAWSKRHEPSADQLDALQANIFSAAAANRGGVVRPVAAWACPSRFVPFAAALACCALAIALALWFAVPGPVTSAALPAASQPPIDHLQRLHTEMDRLFEQRLAWIAETNQEVCLGLDAVSSTSGPHVAVRVLVLTRDANAKDWQPIWTGDVVCRPEELVQVSSTRDAARLNLWTHILPDGTVAVDTELGLERNGPVWTSSTAQEPQVPRRLAVGSAQGNEFQVWQTVTLLPVGAL